MIAIIKGSNSVYTSFVFGFEVSSWKSKVVVLDELLEELICVDYWSSFGNRNVLFIDHNLDNYAYNTDSYKSYWNDKNIFKTVENKKYTDQMLKQAKMIQQSIKSDKWIKLKSKNELDSLMASSGSFHDAYIVYMRQEDDCLEVLFNTTWNAYIKLKCKGVIKNYLSLDDVFNDCYYEIFDDKVKLMFDSFNSSTDVILEAGEMKFIPYHDFIYEFKDYLINEDEIIFYNDKNVVKTIKCSQLVADTILDNNTIGIIRPLYDEYNITLFLDDYFITFKNNDYKDDEEKYQSLCDDIILNFNQYELSLYKNIDYFTYFEPNYGDVIYEENHKKICSFLYMFKYVSIPLTLHILFWLVLKLLSPEMKWIAFYIFGLGISVLVFIIVLIVYFNEYNKPISLKIHERVIIIQRGIQSFYLNYECITKVIQKKKHIILKTKWNTKYIIICCDNKEYVCDLIEERIKLAKETQ